MLLFIHTLVMIVMMNVIAIMNVIMNTMCYNMDMEKTITCLFRMNVVILDWTMVNLWIMYMLLWTWYEHTWYLIIIWSSSRIDICRKALWLMNDFQVVCLWRLDYGLVRIGYKSDTPTHVWTCLMSILMSNELEWKST